MGGATLEEWRAVDILQCFPSTCQEGIDVWQCSRHCSKTSPMHRWIKMMSSWKGWEPGGDVASE